MNKMNVTKSIAWFLGISMFMFGLLKFTDPFKGWYTAQITNSGMGEFSYAMGILGEIAAGTILLFCLLYKSHLPDRLYSLLITTSLSLIVVMMSTGIYVHLHPDVPADVLP